MFAYFIRYDTWLRYILGILSCIFTLYYLLFQKLGNFVIYISDEWFITKLHLNYICVCIDMFVYIINSVCIDMFVHVITVFCWYISAYYNGVFIFIFVYVIKYNCWIYFILVFCSMYPLYMGYSTTVFSLNSFFCERYIYGYWDMFVNLIRSTNWLRYILGILSCVFPAYSLLYHFGHLRWPAFTKVG